MKKHREKYASTWSDAEKKSILSFQQNLTARQEHQVRYSECVYLKERRKGAKARMEADAKRALRFVLGVKKNG